MGTSESTAPLDVAPFVTVSKFNFKRPNKGFFSSPCHIKNNCFSFLTFHDFSYVHEKLFKKSDQRNNDLFISETTISSV